jgi:4-hydroxy-tetrahydrodipicolinate reductase
MLKTMIYGANGKMSQIVAKLCENHQKIQVVAGVDQTPNKLANYFPVFKSPTEYKGEVDLIIDFSHPSYFKSLITYALEKKAAVVIATTGFSNEHFNQMEEAATKIPILYSSNMSLGVNILNHILKQYTKVLSESFDIEIIEKHHNRKLDAPSGTAYLLANTMNEALDHSKEFIYGRNGDSLRNINQIGIHAVRGGTIAGEHTVLFAGNEELIEIKHSALSREIFASGAIKAGIVIQAKPPGFYKMDDIFNF